MYIVSITYLLTYQVNKFSRFILHMFFTFSTYITNMNIRTTSFVYVCFVTSTFAIDAVPYNWQNLIQSYLENNIDIIVQDFDAGIENSKCKTALKHFYEGVLVNEKWALKMLDAWAKPQTGILVGNAVHIGNYDECLDVNTYFNDTHIKGMYCSAFIEPEPKMAKMLIEFIHGFSDEKNKTYGGLMNFIDVLKMSWGICLPSICTRKDLKTIWNFTQNYFDLKFKLNFLNEFCDFKGKHTLTPLSIFTIVFLAMFAFIIVCCTIYDLLIHQKTKSSSRASSILIAFSAYTNSKKILSSNTGENMNCLNGLRVISMLWIILAHRFIFVYFIPHINTNVLQKWKVQPQNMFIVAAVLGVDTFFTVSGFLVAYVYFQNKQKGIRIRLWTFYLHRFLRLTPALAAVVLVFSSLLFDLGNGPFWPIVYQLFQYNCEKNWWATLLYIQNYVYSNSHCASHAWYLAVDMQLYVLSPLLLFPLSKWPKRTMIVVVCLTLLSSASVFIETWIYKLGSTYFDENEEYHRKYIATHNRASSWLIGLAMGYIISKIKNKPIYINKIVVLILWVLTLMVLSSIILSHVSFTRNEYNVFKSAIFNAFMQPSWALGISWIIFACVTGYGGIINSFLSLSIFNKIIKINYSLYLLHIVPLVYVICSGRNSTYFDTFNEMYWVWSDFVGAIILAFVWTLMFESPIIMLEKIIFKRK